MMASFTMTTLLGPRDCKCQGADAGYPGTPLRESRGNSPFSAETPDIACGSQVGMMKTEQLPTLVKTTKHTSISVDPAHSPLPHVPTELVGVARKGYSGQIWEVYRRDPMDPNKAQEERSTS